MNPHRRALRYARAVVSGRRIACKYVRLACERQLRDLERQDDPKWPYYYDPARADQAALFIELLPHTKGRWAQRGERLVLADWECFIVCTIFGWRRREDGARRFREAYDEVPRKNGKSTLAAGIANYCFSGDGEFGAEVYCGATTEHQAWEVFRPARLQALRCEQYREHFGIMVMAKSLVILEDASRLEPLIGDPGDGSSPSCAIVDEFHEHKDPDLYDTMRTGMGARTQPLMFIITTAGSNTAGPCYEKRDEAIKVLEGTFRDETLFAIIYTVDEEDLEKWYTVRALRKANPNYGVSVSGDYLKTEARQARRLPSKQNTFKTKHLNVWTGAASAWLNMVDWNRCRDAELRLADFAGETCWNGLDLASKLDVASDVKVFKRRVDDELHWYWFARHYLPEDTIEESPMRSRYEAWVTEGWLQRTEGAEIDFDVIRDEILRDAGILVEDERPTFQLEEIDYDPWRATQLAHQLDKQGATVVEIASTRKNMNPAMRELEAAMATGRFHHNGDPVLGWMASNVIAKEVRGALMPEKESAEKKIDGLVAGLMAMGRALLAEPKGSVSGRAIFA